MAVTQKAPQFPLTDANGRNYRTYKNKRGRTVKVYEPRPADYTPPLTERDKKEAVIAAYSGEPKKGDYIPGNKGSGVVYDGEKWVYHGQGAFKSKSAGGKEYFTDARFDEAVNNLSPEAWRDLEKKGIVDSKNVDYYANNPLPVESPEGTELVKYPNDMISSETDYMMFKFYEYVPPFGSEVERPRDNFFDPEDKKSKSQVLNQTLGAYNSSVAFSAKEAEGYKTIILYMPEDIQDAFSAGWQGKAFGNISAGIISSTAGADDFIDSLGKLKNTADGALNRLGTNAAAESITKLATSITGDTITTGDVFSSAKGVIRNPNTEVLFQEMNLKNPCCIPRNHLIEDALKHAVNGDMAEINLMTKLLQEPFIEKDNYEKAKEILGANTLILRGKTFKIKHIGEITNSILTNFADYNPELNNTVWAGSLKKQNSNYIFNVDCKIDGVSLSVIYKNNKQGVPK